MVYINPKQLYRNGIRYLARDKNGVLYGYTYKPVKTEKYGTWAIHKYNSQGYPIEMSRNKIDFAKDIKWSDKEPTNIQELL